MDMAGYADLKSGTDSSCQLNRLKGLLEDQYHGNPHVVPRVRSVNAYNSEMRICTIILATKLVDNPFNCLLTLYFGDPIPLQKILDSTA